MKSRRRRYKASSPEVMMIQLAKDNRELRKKRAALRQIGPAVVTICPNLRKDVAVELELYLDLDLELDLELELELN